MQFEWNARTQITMWFDNTEEEASLLRDYGMENEPFFTMLLFSTMSSKKSYSTLEFVRPIQC